SNMFNLMLNFTRTAVVKQAYCLSGTFRRATNSLAGGRSMIEQLTDLPDNAVGFKLSGKLHDEDYKKFVPLVDDAIAKSGKARILAQFHDFKGWDMHALWDDIKFSTTHCTKIDRIALVGDKTWEKWMAKVCKPFTMAKIKYFDVSALPAAKAWLSEA